MSSIGSETYVRSHRDLYQCSCAELDELVGVCKEAGALGSRLTGAGAEPLSWHPSPSSI